MSTFDDNYRKCEECGEYFPNDEMTDVGGRYEYKWICETCLEEEYFYCESCEEYRPNENIIYMKPKLNIRPYIASIKGKGYGVQLSDCERRLLFYKRM